MSVDHRDVLRAVAAYGLSGSLTRLPEGPLDDDAWSSLRAGAVREGLQGQLAWAIANGALHATAAQRERAVDLHNAAMVGCLRLERLLVEALGALRSADVPVRVLKGPALAHTAYGDASLRVFRDIDLLVRTEDRDDVVPALRDVGLQSLVQGPQPDDGHSRIAIMYRSDGLTVDLHATIAPGRFAPDLDVDVLFDTSASYLLAGVQVPMLTPEQQLIHACFVALSAPRRRWVSLRDISQLILNTDAEADAVVDLAQRWTTASAVARAIRLTWQQFELADRVPLSEWAAREDGARGNDQRSASAARSGPTDRSGLWDTLRRLGNTTVTTGDRKR